MVSFGSCTLPCVEYNQLVELISDIEKLFALRAQARTEEARWLS